MTFSSNNDLSVLLLIVFLCVTALIIAAEREARSIQRSKRRRRTDCQSQTLHLWRLAGVLIVGIGSVAGWSMLFQILKA